MSEWTKYKISTLIESKALVIGDGYRAKNSELSTDEGLPFARAGDINNGFQLENVECLAPENLHKAGEKISQTGDALFTSKGTVGRVAFVTDETPEFVYSPQLTWWRVIDTQQIYPEFLYCWMRGQEFISQINSFSGQTDMAAYVSLKDQRQMMYITLPKIEEQQKITAVISCLDRKISNLSQQNETLERIAQTLFKHWFVDFEFPNEDGKPHKSSGGEMVRSELGEIPAGWRFGKLGDVVNVNAKSISNGYRHTNIEYVDISSVGIGKLESTSSYCLKDAPSRARRLVTHGDVIWSGVRPNRKSYLFISHPPETLVVSTGFITLTPILILSSYLYSWVTTDSFVEYLTFNASGSAYPAVKAEHFEIADILLPDSPLLDKFHAVVDPMREKIHQNALQIETLTKTRDVLLPKLMSGKLRITAS